MIESAAMDLPGIALHAPGLIGARLETEIEMNEVK
jgi:hypothetical protein